MEPLQLTPEEIEKYYAEPGFDRRANYDRVNEPLIERVSRAIMAFLTCSTPKHEREKELKLKVYERAQQIQNGRFLALDKDMVRIKYKVSTSHGHGSHAHSHEPSRPNPAGPGPRRIDSCVRGLIHSDSISLKAVCAEPEIKEKFDEIILSEKLQPVFKFLTKGQVANIRAEIFKSKIMFNNQMCSLKEKGKRLLATQAIDAEMDDC